MIEIAAFAVDITPTPGLPLSGFAFRENQPSTHIDDPIQARVLVVRSQEEYYLLASYELLGVGAELQNQILDLLNKEYPERFNTHNCFLTAVHNHSAPVTMHLEGESLPDSHYLSFVAEQTGFAVKQAIHKLQPGQAFIASKEIIGLTYNRRALLSDGRVTMALAPDGDVIERGPIDSLLTFILFKTLSGDPLAGIVHFPCHGVAVCTTGITHDVPGRISQKMEQLTGAPCLYLQGGAGDINPTVVSTTHDKLDEWSNAFNQQIEDLLLRLQPLSIDSLAAKTVTLDLRFQELPKREVVTQNLEILKKVSRGDIQSDDVQEALQNIANIINLKPGTLPDVKKAIYFANALIKTNENILHSIDSNAQDNFVPLHINFWRFGSVRLILINAELFARTSLLIRNLSPDSNNLLVTYSGPVVGYIPDKDEMQKGGYEVNDAWMFYGQPAPFTFDAIDQILNAIINELKNSKNGCEKKGT